MIFFRLFFNLGVGFLVCLYVFPPMNNSEILMQAHGMFRVYMHRSVLQKIGNLSAVSVCHYHHVRGSEREKRCALFVRKEND